MSTKLISVNRKLSAQKYNSTGVTPYSPAATDTYFNRTILLLHGDGTNNANNTVFVDGSTSAITLTTNGRPVQGTYGPFSQTGWSNYFDGTGDYVSTTSPGTAFQFGTNNWTIEAWVYPTATGTTQTVFQIYGTTIDNIQLQFNGTSKAFFCDLRGTNQTLVTLTSTVLATLNQWNHVVLTRDSTTTVKMYVNGSLGVTQAIASTTTFTDTQFSGNPTIGAKTNTVGNYFTGYVSNLRVVSGSAVYTGAFTPPTSALSVITGTVLLTCQDNRFKDNSSNNFTLTNNADASVQPFSPFAPSSVYSTSAVGGSISFNGSSDYLSGSGDPFGALTGNFTVEFWVYKNDAWSTSSQMIFDAAAASSMGVWVNTGSGTLRMSRSGVDAPIEYSYSTLTPNQWYHIAFARSSTTLSMFVNGNRVNTVTSSASFATGTTFNIGRNTAASQYWNGYVSNFRAVKGSAVYDPSQTSITVPTSPLTAVANTSLLLSATNAGIIDHTAKNVITTVGSGSKISNTQSKFGSYSINQDGTNSYVSIPSKALFDFGSGEFTIECWVYVAATNVRTAFFSKSNSAGTTVPFLLEMTTAGLPQAIAQDTTSQKVITGTGNALTVNTWTHLALVRSGNTLTLYKDGTSIGTPQTMSGALVTSTDEIRIGVNKFGSSSVNFYIDDIRVTAGYARYTSNFTAPTSVFIDQ